MAVLSGIITLASAHVGPLLFPIKSILGKICMAVLYPSAVAVDYQRRACQHPCADECRCDAADANLMFLLSCSHRRGQHLISRNEAKPVSCHWILKIWPNERSLPEEVGGALISAVDGPSTAFIGAQSNYRPRMRPAEELRLQVNRI